MSALMTVAKKALRILADNGFEAFLVGGMVRDIIMNRAIHDIDISTDALPQEILKSFASYHTIETGIKHGTVTVIIDSCPVEITTYRIEGDYSDGRHPDSVIFSKKLINDLSRRDFTVNSMAMDIDGTIVDPYGGINDIKSKIIRTVGKSENRFNEDALRILRALRFSSVLGFEIDNETKRAIFSCRENLKLLSKERICSELSGILCGKLAGEIVLNYAEVIGEVIPQILKMKGFCQHNPHHCFDVLKHTCVALDNVRPVLYMRLAALLHDCAKPDCFSFDENGIGHFYSHAPIGARIAKDILSELRFDSDTISKVEKLIRIHDSPIECNERTVKRKLSRLGEEMFFDLIELQRADNLAQSKDYLYRQEKFDCLVSIANSIIAKEECFSVKQLNVSGYDVIELGLNGRKIGEALNFLVEAVIDGRVENKKEELKLYILHHF